MAHIQKGMAPEGQSDQLPKGEFQFTTGMFAGTRQYVLFSAVFLVLGYLSVEASFHVAPCTPFPQVWLLPGILLVASIFGGTRVAIAALLGGVISLQAHPIPVNVLIASFLATAALTLAGRHFVRHSLDDQLTSSPGRVLAILVLAGVGAGSAMAATLQVGLLHLWSLSGVAIPFESAWRETLVSYLIGGLLVTPGLALVLATRSQIHRAGGTFERMLLIASLVAISFMLGVPDSLASLGQLLPMHVISVLLVWAGFRLTLREAAICILTVTLGMISGRALSGNVIVFKDGAFLTTLGIMSLVQLSTLYLSIVCTGWRQSRLRLREGEERYRSAMEVLPCGVVVQDSSGRIISANPSAERILGLSLDQLLGLTSLDPRWKSIHRDGTPFPGSEHPAMVSLRTGEPQSGVVMGIEKPNGAQTWISINTQPITDPISRTVTRVVVSFEDITESRLRLEELKQSEQRFRYLSLATRDAVYQWDVTSGDLWRDATYQQMFAPMSKPTIAHTWWEGQVHREDKERVCKFIESFVGGAEERYSLEYRLKRWDGRYASVLDRGFIQRDAKGKAVLVVGAITDLTEQQQVEEELRMSQERYRALVNDQQDLVVRYDPDGTLTFVNQAHLQFYGKKSEDELIGTRWIDLLPPAQQRESEKYLRKVASESGVHTCTESMVRSDGQVRTVEWIDRTITDSKGEVIEIVGVGRDITERVEWNQRIEESEKRFQLLAENLDAAFWIFDPVAHSTIYVNRAFEAIWRRPISEALGSSPAYYESIFPDDRAMVTAAYKNAETSVPLDLEYRIIRPGGEIRWIAERAFPVCDEKGTLVRWIGLSQDSTARKKEQTELAENERLYRLLTEHSSDLVSQHAPDGTFLYASPASERIIGYAPDELVGKKVCEFIHPDDSPATCSRVPGPGDAPVTTQFRMIRKSGELVWVEMVIHPSQNIIAEGKAELHCTTRDISRRVTNEADAQRLSGAIEQSTNMMALTDSRGMVTYANRAFLDQTGLSIEEAIGVSVASLAFIGDMNAGSELQQAISCGERWSGKARIAVKSGEPFWARVTMSPVFGAQGSITHFLVVWENIDNEVSALERHIEAEKLTSMGLLAAEVAHEFKNYLGGIIGHASFALEEISKTDGKDVARESLEKIVEMGERANDISMGLLTLSKFQPTDLQEESIEEIVTRALAMVEKDLASQGIQIVKKFDAVPHVHVAASRVQQVILNLLINARHAIQKQGTITVTIAGVKDRVQVSVSDTGAGITKANISRIFDPFFSTKGVWGKDEVVGTGMGLALCRTIAREHSGDLTVQSAEGVGTTFTLDLPATSTYANPARKKLREKREAVGVFTIDANVMRSLAGGSQSGNENVILFRSEEELRALHLAESSLIVLDARFSAKLELLRVGRHCLQGSLTYVLINASGLEYQLEELCTHALAVYKETPRLDAILNARSSARV